MKCSHPEQIPTSLIGIHFPSRLKPGLEIAFFRQIANMSQLYALRFPAQPQSTFPHDGPRCRHSAAGLDGKHVEPLPSLWYTAPQEQRIFPLIFGICLPHGQFSEEVVMSHRVSWLFAAVLQL